MGTDIHLYVEQRQSDDTWAQADLSYKVRNYDVFAMLAGVRNGFGFAGIKTGDGFIPIAPAKGLPEDASVPTRTEAGDWGLDGHNHSWLTLAELNAYDWDTTTRKTGLVADTDDGDFAGGGRATAWQRYAEEHSTPPPWGEDYLIGISDSGGHLYERVTWTTRYRDCADPKFWTLVTDMGKLAGDDPTSVRTIFWFDS